MRKCFIDPGPGRTICFYAPVDVTTVSFHHPTNQLIPYTIQCHPVYTIYVYHEILNWYFNAMPNFAKSFLIFRKKGMVFHENRLLADDCHKISCLTCYF